MVSFLRSLPWMLLPAKRPQSCPGKVFLHPIHSEHTHLRLCLFDPSPVGFLKQVLTFSSVTSYSAPSATLTLVYPCPDDRPPARALVNVELVLARLGWEQTRVGEWVNVLGYITSVSSSVGCNSLGSPGSPPVHVQALLVWSAGSIDVQRYEASVQSLTSAHGGVNGGNIPSNSVVGGLD